MSQNRRKKEELLKQIRQTKRILRKTIIPEEGLFERLDALEEEVVNVGKIEANMQGVLEAKAEKLRSLLHEYQNIKLEREKRARKRLFLIAAFLIPLGLLFNFPYSQVNKLFNFQYLLTYVLMILLMSLLLYGCFVLYFRSFYFIQKKLIMPHLIWLDIRIKALLYFLIGLIFVFLFFNVFNTFFLAQSKLLYKSFAPFLNEFVRVIISFSYSSTANAIATDATILLFSIGVARGIWKLGGKRAKK